MSKYRKQQKEKEIIIKRICEAAQIYKERLVGKTFLILFEGHSIEVMFKADNFLHLCGVDTYLYAKDFYKKALKIELQKYKKK